MSVLQELAVIIPVSSTETEGSKLIKSLKKLLPGVELHTVTGKHRALQLNQGAALTEKKFLWFLHADSVVNLSCISALEVALQRDPGALYYFKLGFEKSGSPLMALNSLGANLRSNFLKMPFGDQGFSLSRINFQRLDGFNETVPYGEDHLFVWKARQSGIKVLCTGSTIVTSSRKYTENGWLRTTLKHLWLTYRQAAPEAVRLLRRRKVRAGALAIFVKTPGLSPVKTRLAASIGKEKAEEAYLRLVHITERVALEAKAKLNMTPYWAVAEESGSHNPLWKEFPKISQGEGGLGERLSKIYNELLETHECVFLIGADCPDLDLIILKNAAQQLKSTNCVLGPTKDGGFYLFGGRIRISKSVWTKVPYSTDKTARLLIEELKAYGSVAELQELYDVDTVEDLNNTLQYLSH